MQVIRVTGLASVLFLVAACFFPWVTIETKNIVVTGIQATGTGFGKPGFFHFLMAALYLFFLFPKGDWSIKVNFFVAALNIGWALRNYIIISTCYGGECPVKHAALYCTLIASILMLAVLLLPVKRLAEAEE
jgi:hypothetical protein